MSRDDERVRKERDEEILTAEIPDTDFAVDYCQGCEYCAADWVFDRSLWPALEGPLKAKLLEDPLKEVKPAERQPFCYAAVQRRRRAS